jgi:hypothetical protein
MTGGRGWRYDSEPMTRRILILLLAAGLGFGLVFFYGTQPAHSPTAPPTSIPSTISAPTTTAPATAPVAVEDYGGVLHADLANYPATQPWDSPVDLPDAAHIILHEPIYVCSRGDLWIVRPDADPLPTVLARAGNETEHIIDRPVQYIVWTIDRKGNWQARAICWNGNEFVLVSETDEIPLGRRPDYRWDSALTWDDNGTTRLVVPTNHGVSVITLGTPLSVSDVLLRTKIPDFIVSPADTEWRAHVLFDMRGVLAWIPDPLLSPPETSVARFVDGHWVKLDPNLWPADIIHLVPMLDGSVLQIRRGSDAQTVQLSIVQLDASAIDQNAVSALVDQLADDDPDKRVAAFARLTQYGPSVFPILEQLQPNAAPEAQSRIADLLAGKLAPRLGGMLVNDNQLTLLTRLPDGGAVFCAPHGLTIPNQPAAQNSAVDYLVIRPGRAISRLPTAIAAKLNPTDQLSAIRDEWIVTDPAAGPLRYLPPDQFVPLLGDSEKEFTQLLAIDGRGRWLFRKWKSDSPTLILDPTVPDPTPRLAIWSIDSGQEAGWSDADWPALVRGTNHWILTDRDWELMPADAKMQTAAPPEGGPLLIGPDGTQYADGRNNISVTSAGGKTQIVTLPEDCVDSENVRPWLVRDGDGHLFLINAPDQIVRFRIDPAGGLPAIDAVFKKSMPMIHDIQRVWIDPAGRIDVAYDKSHLEIIFPTGQIPAGISDQVLPQDVIRVQSP